MLLGEWMLRPNGHPFDPYAVYSKFPSVFSLEIHHDGKLSQAPNRLYDGGKVNWFDQIDSDGFSVVEVNQMLKCLGYLNPKMEFLAKWLSEVDSFKINSSTQVCKLAAMYNVALFAVKTCDRTNAA
ncbi:hypothetical protein Tco_0768038 [Tanacetum coccineum]